MSYELRALSDDDGCNALSLGDPAFQPLKSFLRKEAKRLHRTNLAKTFVIVEKGQSRVLAYVTMVCTHVAVEQFQEPAPVDEYRYADYPAVKLARLAVDTSLQSQGIGSQLVDFVVGSATEHIMPHAGCRFMVVDAKRQSVDFYERKGFVRIGESIDGAEVTTTMFIDLHRLPGT